MMSMDFSRPNFEALSIFGTLVGWPIGGVPEERAAQLHYKFLNFLLSSEIW